MSTAVSVRLLTVSTVSGEVSDNRTGYAIHSELLQGLVAKVLASRRQQQLSVEDVLAVASRVPFVAARLASGCAEISTGGEGTANSIYVALRESCGSGPNENRIVLSVNPRTGEVSDPRTMKVVASRDSQAVAHAAIRRIAATDAADRDALSRSCPGR